MATNKLIEGQWKMKEAGRDTSVESFAKGLNEQMVKAENEDAKDKAKIMKWADELGTPDAILKVDKGDKKVIRDWTKKMSKLYVEASKKYDESGDDEDKEERDDILERYRNLSLQLDEYVLDKKNYLKDFEDGILITGQFDNSWYANNYTKDAEDQEFDINDDGDLIFMDDAKSTFKSKKGKYDIKNKAATEGIRGIVVDARSKAVNAGKTGPNTFVYGNTYDSVITLIEGTGAEGSKVLAWTDLNENDDDPLTFEQQYKKGLLDPKLYEMSKGIDSGDVKSATKGDKTAKHSTDWMKNPENMDVLNKMMSTYITDGIQTVSDEVWGESFNQTDNMSFLDTPNKGIYVGAMNQNAPRSASKDLYDWLKSGGDGTLKFLGAGFTYDPLGDKYIVTQDGGKKTYSGVEALMSGMGISDPAFGSLKDRKDHKGGGDGKGGAITLDLSLVTTKPDDNLFEKFEEVAPGFSFTHSTHRKNGTKRTSMSHDKYIVKAPNGKEMEIHLNRNWGGQEKTRKKLEKFFNDNIN